MLLMFILTSFTFNFQIPLLLSPPYLLKKKNLYISIYDKKNQT